MTNTQTLTNQITTILNALLLQGIQTAVLAPGSRSTPLALGLAQLARENKLKLYVDIDERSAAFFALGIAKTTARPVLLLCTSGTAAANFYPAICEANSSHIPLIVLTTDRPPELTKIGAPQALDQDHFYGQQVKQFWQLPLASDDPAECHYTNFIVQRSVIQATSLPCGPVHLNLPLRKPLMPRLPFSFATNNIPQKIDRLTSKSSLTSADFTALTTKIAGKRGLIIAGPSEIDMPANSLLRWAENACWPILADPLSQLRGYDSNCIISAYDILLKTKHSILKMLKPEIIIRFGGTFVSASLASWLKELRVPTYYLDPNCELNDYTETTTKLLPLSEADFFENCPAPVAQPSWLSQWSKAQEIIKRSWDSTSPQKVVSEALLPHLLERALAPNTHLFISNSMPIRDIDSYYLPQTKFCYLYCNRGANGIDGVISSALGMSSQFQNNVLLIGDLAFFHDMNGLMMAYRYALQLRIIVINNNGGGIFSFLPQVGSTDFETVFGTPQNLSIKQTALLYHAEYTRIQNSADFVKKLQHSPHGLEIIEVITDRAANVEQHQNTVQQIKQKLSEEFY